MPFDTKAITNYLLDHVSSQRGSVSHLKLQKLLYYAHGWHLGFGLGPLLNDRVEAWKYGPVVPTVYHEFKACGDDPIKDEKRFYVRRDVGDGGSKRWVAPTLGNDTQSEETARLLIAKVWEIYGGYTPLQLSNMTHQHGSPWYITWFERGGKDRTSTDIDDKLMEDHFRALAKAGAKPE